MVKKYHTLILILIMAALAPGCRKSGVNSIITNTGLLSKVVYLDTTLAHPFDTVSSVEYFFDSQDRVTTVIWNFSYQAQQGYPQYYHFKLRRTSFFYTGTDSLPYMSNNISFIKLNYPDPFIPDNTEFSTILYQYDNAGRKVADSMIIWYGVNKIDYKFTYLPGKIAIYYPQYRVPLSQGKDTATLTPSGANIAWGYQKCYVGIDGISYISREMTYDQMQNPFNRLNIASTLYYAPPFNAVTFQGPEIYQPFYFNKNNFSTQKFTSLYIAFYFPQVNFPFLENEYSYTYQYTPDGYPSLGYFTNIKHLSGGGITTTVIKALYTYR